MKLFKREKYLSKIRPFYGADDIIKVITGVRRCGKSVLMELISEEIMETGVERDRVIYIDLDKRGFRSIKSADQLDKLIEDLSVGDGLKYLFIDEIQNVDGFEEVINGYRTDGGYSIFITGSNSYLLSGELVTMLTGRYLEFEMFPLSFDEYEDMKTFYEMDIEGDPLEELNRYIKGGGFPRSLFLETEDARRLYTDGIVNEVFEKDIRKRVKIRNRASFDVIRDFVVNNHGSTMSINSIQSAMKGIGVNIGRETIARYIRSLCDAKILYECDRFDMKSKKALSGEKKYYLSDLSFYFSKNTDNRINYGPELENLIYIYSKGLGLSVSVGRIGKLECDFIVRDNQMNYAYLQVAYTILASRDTEDREYRPLEQINDNYEKYVMTTDRLLQKRNGIRHVNLVDFMKKKKNYW